MGSEMLVNSDLYVRLTDRKLVVHVVDTFRTNPLPQAKKSTGFRQLMMMKFFEDTPLLVFIFLVATCKQKIAIAYGEPVSRVISSFDHRENPATIGYHGTESNSQEHIEPSFTHNTLGDGKSELRGKSSLSDEKKQQTPKNSKENENKIKGNSWPNNLLQGSIQDFEHKFKPILQYGNTQGIEQIRSNLDALKKLHAQYYLSSIHEQLFTLRESGSSRAGLGPGHEKKHFGPASSTSSQETAMSHQSNLYVREKPPLAPVDAPHESQSTAPRRNLGYMKRIPEPSSETSGIRFHEQDWPGVRNAQVLIEPKSEELLRHLQRLPKNLKKQVSNKVHLGRVNDLQEILHKPVFPNLEKFEISSQKEMLDMKTSFEKLVFETLEALHDFQLIGKDEYESFFRSPQTLKSIARHCCEITKYQHGMLSGFPTVVPRQNFLAEIRGTAHIGRLLDGLDDADKHHVLHAVLEAAKQEHNKGRA